MANRKNLNTRENSVSRTLQMLWRKTLTEDQRDYWRAAFLKDQTQKALREKILAELKIDLKHDHQMKRFRDWVAEQDAWELNAQQMADDEAEIRKKYPNLTFDKARDLVLEKAYCRALKANDLKLGMQVVRMQTHVQRYLLDKAKFQFNASEECLSRLPELRAIQNNPGLTEAQKLREIRLKLFGRIAEEQPQAEGRPVRETNDETGPSI